jgi:hypothetical protein
MRHPGYRCLAICAAVLALTTTSPASAMTTDEVVNDTRTFVEWAFGFKLDPAAVQSIRAGTAIDMSSDPANVEANVKDMNDTMAWVGSHSAREGTLLRSLIEPELVAAWQGDTSASAATAKTLVAAWEKHNVIIASGTPPLRQKVVNSYISMFEFLSKQAGKSVPSAVSNHAQFTKQVAAQYSAASPDVQIQFNKVETLWYALQAMWQEATPAQQAAMRQQWRGSSSSGAIASAHARTAPPRQGAFSSQTWNEGSYKEHLFVSSQAQVMMSTWSNPFSH